jgi:hypothetical protein
MSWIITRTSLSTVDATSSHSVKSPAYLSWRRWRKDTRWESIGLDERREKGKKVSGKVVLPKVKHNQPTISAAVIIFPPGSFRLPPTQSSLLLFVAFTMVGCLL